MGFFSKVKQGWLVAKLMVMLAFFQRSLKKGTVTMDMVMGILRAILAAGGGLLVNKGWMDEGSVETITGAIIVIVTGVWSCISKAKANKALAAAKKAPAE